MAGLAGGPHGPSGAPAGGPPGAAAPLKAAPAGRPAVFLDRDGTLNLDRGYAWRWEDFEWLPGAVEALRLLQGQGLFVAVVTNQAGVARGLYRAEDVAALHRRVAADLERRGLAPPPFYHCPHHPDFTGPCGCRKPAPGMLLQAAADHGLDLSRSFMVGDKLSDLGAGLAAGCVSILVRTGYGAGIAALPPTALEAPDVLEASRLILKLAR
ncbi:MAG: HAD family hydrolase [Deltaproteobacteria bacterium]|nr:HAD family hydrolase [Deltaproteobacteria bacterium]